MKLLLRTATIGWLGWLAAGPLAAQNAAPTPWVDTPYAPTLVSGPAIYGQGVQLPTATATWVWLVGSYGLQEYTDGLNLSTDNGQTWQRYGVPYSYNQNNTYGKGLLAFSALDAQQAWVLEREPTGVITSTYRVRRIQAGTAGFSTTAAVVAPGSTPGALYFFDATTGLVAASTNGQRALYRTTDAGQTWAPVPTNAAIAAPVWNAVHQLGTHLWVSAAGQLLHTPDAGQTWTLTTPPEPLVQVAFRDALHGLAYGSSSGNPLYRTADGGGTWALVASTGARRLTGLQAFPGAAGTYFSFGGLLVPGDQAGSAVSYDEGQTWQNLESATKLSAAAASPDGRLWALYANNQTLGSTPPMLLRLGSAALAATAPAPAGAAGIYPNPTTGLVRLPVAGPYQQVAVYDVAGRHCRTVALGAAETPLDLGSLRAGLYVLHLSGGTALPQTQRIAVMH